MHCFGGSPGTKGWETGFKNYFLVCLGLWVLELMQFFLFWLILKNFGTSAQNAAEFEMILAEQFLIGLGIVNNHRKFISL